MASKVVLRYLDGRDKITLLNQVLDVAGFEKALEERLAATGKPRAEFGVVIKPNASMYIRKDEDGVTTDAVLVLALIERLHEKGFSKISVVESSNLYQAGFENRNPVTVMAAMGLAGGMHGFVPASDGITAHVLTAQGGLLPYRLVNLASDTVVVDAPGMPHGRLKLGAEWLHADFRISFAKFKTHIYDGYTMVVKNTYGCLPEGDKMWHYHKQTGAARPAVEQLRLCPVHFGIIDGITGADGLFGVKWDRAIPRRPGFILAGRNIGEVERVGCRIMNVQPARSRMSRQALELLKEPSELDGRIRPLGTWWNVWPFVIPLVYILERIYLLHRFLQMVSDFLGSPPFSRNRKGRFFTVLGFLLLLPALMYAGTKRHWVVRKWREWRRRRGAGVGAGIPSGILCRLDRLGGSELGVLGEVLKAGPGQPLVYGHRLKAAGRIFELPDSTSFNMFRVAELIEMAGEDGMREVVAQAAGRLAAASPGA
ncbi:MAG: DUF362 domain-containing protein [Myxococcota bacterium]|jgi:uncharacterized protein (DUF362 family)